jgi:hypothetical protein
MPFLAVVLAFMVGFGAEVGSCVGLDFGANWSFGCSWDLGGMGFFLKKNRGGWGSMAIRFPLYQELSFL